MTAIAALRAPEDAFASLPGFPWAPRYLDGLPGYAGLRLHYVDEGPRGAGTTFLCVHGEPTWAYLFRRMIPVFVHLSLVLMLGLWIPPFLADWYRSAAKLIG